MKTGSIVGTVLGSVAAVGALAGLGAWAAGRERRPATRRFREEHARIRAELERVRGWLSGLDRQPASEQRARAQRVARFFTEQLKPHAEWEEAHLYPLVDRLAGLRGRPFTATMRHEHRIVARQADELFDAAIGPALDATEFELRAAGLWGLVEAHFEEEEEVLLPLIDAAMGRAAFERAVGGHA